MTTVQSKSAILYRKSIAGKLYICVIYNICGPGTPLRKTVFLYSASKVIDGCDTYLLFNIK